jgi:hypothetical protein
MFASDVAAFVVPRDYVVPLVANLASLPPEVEGHSIVHQQVHRSSAVVNGEGTPSLRVTSSPPRGSFGNLRGMVEHVNPVEYQVAVFIYVAGGWWSKPTWTHPAVPVGADGTWEADITTGGIDEQATIIVAVLVPADYVIPRVGGEHALPGQIDAHIAARVDINR